MITLTIDRKYWLHGEGPARSCLYRPSDNKMCCFGFLAITCGADKDMLVGHTVPKAIRGISWPIGVTHLQHGYSVKALELMQVNDDQIRSNEERELLIVEGMKEFGVTVKFEGVY